MELNEEKLIAVAAVPTAKTNSNMNSLVKYTNINFTFELSTIKLRYRG